MGRPFAMGYNPTPFPNAPLLSQRNFPTRLPQPTNHEPPMLIVESAKSSATQNVPSPVIQFAATRKLTQRGAVTILPRQPSTEDKFSLVLAHDQNRTMRAPNHPLGGAANKNAFQAGIAVRGDYNQIRLEIPCRIGDFFRG